MIDKLSLLDNKLRSCRSLNLLRRPWTLNTCKRRHPSVLRGYLEFNAVHAAALQLTILG